MDRQTSTRHGLHRRRALRLPLRCRVGWRGEQGGAAVEMVLVTPLLVALGLFVVLCGRLVSAQLDVDAAAHAASRAASLAHSPGVASHHATAAATEALAGRSLGCQAVSVTVDTAGMRPGGVVAVTVTCTLDLSDLALLQVPGTRTVVSHSSAPVDLYRGA
jgi:Flp pilus assembly protein TadG